MSYILDALNKSEKERARKNTPGLASVHDQPQPAGLKGWQIVLAVIGLVVVNALIMLFVFRERLPDQTSPAMTADTPSAAIETVVKTQTVIADVSTESEPLINPGPVGAATGEPARIQRRETITLAQLPEIVRQEMPELEVTSHLYSSDAEFRMAKINGEARYEGETLPTGHQLLEITETGLILDYNGWVYLVNIVEDWQNFD